MRPNAPDPVRVLAASEHVVAPKKARAPTKKTFKAIAIGVGVGAVFAGPPGALAGGAVGWMYDAIRRKLNASKLADKR